VSDMLSITDATDVKAKVNTWRWKDDDENPGGKQGPDSDAKFGKKSEMKPSFFGYKCAASVDADSGIVTKVEVAPGNVADIDMFPEVADDQALATLPLLNSLCCSLINLIEGTREHGGF
ncbi:MAG TPA: transposase, partial [bacterium]